MPVVGTHACVRRQTSNHDVAGYWRSWAPAAQARRHCLTHWRGRCVMQRRPPCATACSPCHTCSSSYLLYALELNPQLPTSFKETCCEVHWVLFVAACGQAHHAARQRQPATFVPLRLVESILAPSPLSSPACCLLPGAGEQAHDAVGQCRRERGAACRVTPPPGLRPAGGHLLQPAHRAVGLELSLETGQPLQYCNTW